MKPTEGLQVVDRSEGLQVVDRTEGLPVVDHWVSLPASEPRHDPVYAVQKSTRSPQRTIFALVAVIIVLIIAAAGAGVGSFMAGKQHCNGVAAVAQRHEKMPLPPRCIVQYLMSAITALKPPRSQQNRAPV